MNTEDKKNTTTTRTRCIKCKNNIHTKKEHINDYMREYNYNRNEGKVGYRRGIHRPRFEDTETDTITN